MTDYLLEYLNDYLPEEVISIIIRPYSYNVLPIKLQNAIITYFPYFLEVHKNTPYLGITSYSLYRINKI